MTILQRVKCLTTFLCLTTLLAGNQPPVRAQTQGRVETDIGKPRLWTLKHAHQLLARKRWPDQKFRQQTLEDLSQGKPGGLRLGLIGFLDTFDENSKNPTPKKRSVKTYDEPSSQLLGKLDLEVKRKTLDGLFEFFQIDYELIARKLSLLRDDATPGEKIVILEFPRSVYSVSWGTSHRPTGVQWTASALISDGAARQTSRISARAGRTRRGASTGVRVHDQPQRMPARVIDLDPGRKALNEQQNLETLTAPKLGAMAARGPERESLVSFSKWVTETVVGFVEGSQEFGWTFGLPSESHVRPGFEKTYAALAVPAEATSLALTAKVCASAATGKWDCGAPRSFVIGIPSDKTRAPVKGVSAGTAEPRLGTTKEAQSFYESGVKHNEEKRWGEAIEALRKAVYIRPDYAEAHYKLGVALVNLGGYDTALAAFEQAIRLKPDYIDAYHNLGQTHFKLGRFKEAVMAFEQYNKLAPQDTNALLKLVTAHFNQGSYRDAVAVARRVVEIKPESSPAYYALAHSLYRAGDLDESLVAFRKYISLNPENDDGYAWLVMNLREMGRWAEVVEVYDHLIKKKPYHERAGLVAERAFSRLILGKGDEAATDARFFIRLRGWRDDLSSYMALLAHFGYRLSGNETAAREILEEAATRFKNGETVTYSLDGGVEVYPLPNELIRFLRGNLTMTSLARLLAKEYTRDEKRSVEDNNPAHLFIGWHLSLAGRLREALPHLKWAELHADKTSFFYVLGRNEATRVEEVLRSTLPAAEFALLSKSVQEQMSIRPREHDAEEVSVEVGVDDSTVSEVIRAVLAGDLNKSPATKQGEDLSSAVSANDLAEDFTSGHWLSFTFEMLADADNKEAETILKERLAKLPSRNSISVADEDDADDSVRAEKRRLNVNSKFSLGGIIFAPVRPGQRATVVLYGADIPASVGVMIDGVPLIKLEVKTPLKSADTAVTFSEFFIPAEVKDSGALQAQPERAGPEGYFYHDPTFVILSFGMPRGYVGTPVITLVGPQGTEVFNSLPLLVEDETEKLEGLRAAMKGGRRLIRRRLDALPAMFSPARTPLR